MAMSAAESGCWSMLLGSEKLTWAEPAGQHSQVCRREILPKHAVGEHKVDRAGVEELVGGQRQNQLVKEEAVGGTYERGGGKGTIPAVNVGEGLNR